VIAGSATGDRLRNRSDCFSGGQVPHATRTFRLFVSSTFTDLRLERDALQEHVFPALSRLCARENAAFQPIDLRWGVSAEAGLDQQTMIICLTELDRCRNTGLKPYLLILLGDRYGWQPLPPRIPAEEFAQILAVTSDPSGIALLTRWYYERDDNAMPPVHYLKAREPGGEFASQDAWDREEAALRDVLRRGGEALRTRSADLPEETLEKYFTSATEQEINEGALTTADAREHVFCFVRELADLPARVAPLPEVDLARGFRDYLDDGSPDEQAAGALARLKARLQEGLGGNYKTYRAQWAPDADGHFGSSIEHIGVLSPDADVDPDGRVEGDRAGTLCRDVYDALAAVVRRQLATIVRTTAELEDIATAGFVEQHTKFFTGRVSILDRIDAYLDSSAENPLVLWGTSGSGKSTIMAKLVQSALDSERLPGANVIAKFIGATVGSSDARAILEDLNHKIETLYGVERSPGGRTYEDLVQQFPEKLALADRGRPLYLFVDALDQLSEANNARSLVWLPNRIPKNVRMVVTATPGECLEALRRKVDADHVVELGPMTVQEGGDLLDKWLFDVHRRLTGKQRSWVLERFADCPVPLYLRLAFEEARRWTSGAGAEPLAVDTPGLIRQTFARLAEPGQHGPGLVQRVLGNLAAARRGLSEEEMLGVLAWDEEYWQEFVRESHQDLPASMRGSDLEPWRRRIPVAVWVRLFEDLEPYLSEREEEGARVLTFYHRQLGEVAYMDYLADRGASEETRTAVDQIEGALREGTLDAGRILSIPLSDGGRDRHRILAEYFRWTAGGDPPAGGRRWGGTARGLADLPYHLIGAEDWGGVEEVLTDFKFLESKAAAVGIVDQIDVDGNPITLYTGVHQLQGDYDHAIRAMSGQGDDMRRRIIVTAVDLGHGPEIRCPHCGRMIRWQEDYRGREIECPLTGPDCRGPLKVNLFVVGAGHDR